MSDSETPVVGKLEIEKDSSSVFRWTMMTTIKLACRGMHKSCPTRLYRASDTGVSLVPWNLLLCKGRWSYLSGTFGREMHSKNWRMTWRDHEVECKEVWSIHDSIEAKGFGERKNSRHVKCQHCMHVEDWQVIDKLRIRSFHSERSATKVSSRNQSHSFSRENTDKHEK